MQSRSGVSRRSVLALAACGGLAKAQRTRFNLGFSLYGMKTVPVLAGLEHCAKIGYKSVELCMRAGWNTEPKLLTKADRAAIRSRIADLGLSFPSVMENLGLARPGGSRGANLERLRAAAEVCHEVSPGPPALIETTVGGRPPAWDEMKSAMADELAAWARTAEELKTAIAIKAHVLSAMNRPERILWMAEQVKSPWIKLVYDFSHYAAQGLDMRATMQQVASRAAFIHIKDVKGMYPDHRFLLPGDGGVDYRQYVKTLAGVGYRGPVVVEVSVHVFDLPGYDPVAAARHVWDRLSPAFA
jgi:inosose dehydratase